MKILFLSDTHLRSRAPVGRIDDFLAAQTRKWEYILNKCKDLKVEVLIQAGDMWDNPAPPYSLVTKMISMFDWFQYPERILTIIGQHDMMMRSKKHENTIVGLMSIATKVTYFDLYDEPLDIDANLFVHGVGFGNDYDITPVSDARNILVVHDMIGNHPLYPGHDITYAEDFLATWQGFDIILCGDYHYPYMIKSDDGRRILNTGCLLRLSRDERDMTRRPHFWIWDTKTDKWSKHYVPISPYTDVFDLSTKTEKKEHVELDRFIEQLKQKEKVGLSFMENLEAYFEEHNTDEAVIEIVMAAVQAREAR